MKHYIWMNLLGFEMTDPDAGAARYLDTVGFTPDGICVRKREKGVLKDSYEFPSVEVEDGLTVEKALKELGVSAFTLCKEGAYTHIFTHIRWDMSVYHVRTDKQPFTAYPLAEIEEKISLPTAFRQCLSLVEKTRI